jgi:hypothetical protein
VNARARAVIGGGFGTVARGYGPGSWQDIMDREEMAKKASLPDDE